MASEQAAASLSIQRFTSSEAGAWSNAYLISVGSQAILFDVPMLGSDAARLADMVHASAKALTTVMISHAHPDHFMGLDVIIDRFPRARVVSTGSVAADIEQDGPWMLSLLQSKLGPEAPARLVIPQPLSEPVLQIDGMPLEIVEFGEGESKHTATLRLPVVKALIAADLVYNNAHLYLADRHLDSWLARLDELQAFAAERISTIHPGHGAAGDLALIARTRDYLRDFAAAVECGDAQAAEQQMLEKYPEYHARQFLTAFSIPAYFPSTAPS
jgi:glyoxylase-like metal-dependent hydrolase (beta-lactamase superfamily II)